MGNSLVKDFWPIAIRTGVRMRFVHPTARTDQNPDPRNPRGSATREVKGTATGPVLDTEFRCNYCKRQPTAPLQIEGAAPSTAGAVDKTTTDPEGVRHPPRALPDGQPLEKQED